MQTKIVRTALIAVVTIVIALAVLGVMYVFESITGAEFKDYATKVSAAIGILALASIAVSAALSANRAR